MPWSHQGLPVPRILSNVLNRLTIPRNERFQRAWLENEAQEELEDTQDMHEGVLVLDDVEFEVGLSTPIPCLAS